MDKLVWCVQWDKVEDKYAVSSLAVAGFVGLWGSAGLISVSFLCSSSYFMLTLIYSYFILNYRGV